MKLRLAIATLLLCSAGLASAQALPNIAPPPIKMGLWESTVSFTSSGMGPSTRPGGTTRQSCYSPDSWKQAMQNMQSRQQDVKCSTSNLQQDAHHLSFDGECTGQQGYTGSYHVEMILDSDSAMHGTSTVKMSGAMLPQPMTLSSSISSRFISSDCGALKPGESKPIQP